MINSCNDWIDVWWNLVLFSQNEIITIQKSTFLVDLLNYQIDSNDRWRWFSANFFLHPDISDTDLCMPQWHNHQYLSLKRASQKLSGGMWSFCPIFLIHSVYFDHTGFYMGVCLYIEIKVFIHSRKWKKVFQFKNFASNIVKAKRYKVKKKHFPPIFRWHVPFCELNK